MRRQAPPAGRHLHLAGRLGHRPRRLRPLPQAPRHLKPNVAKAARLERLDAEAGKILAQLDVQPVRDPLTELQLLAGQAVAWKDTVAGLVNGLQSLRYETGGGERAEVGLWERALDRCEKVLTAMARLDIDGRLAVIGEEQGQIAASVMRAALADLGLSRDVQDAVRERIAHHLRLAAQRQAITGTRPA